MRFWNFAYGHVHADTSMNALAYTTYSWMQGKLSGQLQWVRHAEADKHVGPKDSRRDIDAQIELEAKVAITRNCDSGIIFKLCFWSCNICDLRNLF